MRFTDKNLRWYSRYRKHGALDSNRTVAEKTWLFRGESPITDRDEGNADTVVLIANALQAANTVMTIYVSIKLLGDAKHHQTMFLKSNGASECNLAHNCINATTDQSAST